MILILILLFLILLFYFIEEINIIIPKLDLIIFKFYEKIELKESLVTLNYIYSNITDNLNFEIIIKTKIYI